jgi:hypothetical protein
MQLGSSIFLLGAIGMIVDITAPDAARGPVSGGVATAWATGLSLSILLPLGEVVEHAARKVRAALARGWSR